MPAIRQAGDIPAAYSSLLQAVADGDLSPTEALQVLPVSSVAAKAFDFELEPAFQPDALRSPVGRLAEMEEMHNAKTAEDPPEDAA